MIKLNRLNLSLITFIAANIMLRSVGLARPLLGNFDSYQTGQAMMSVFFAQDFFSSLWFPKTYVLVNGEPSVVLLYYPVASLVVGLLHFLTNVPIDILGRAQAVVCHALTLVVLYRWLVNRLSVKQTWIILWAYSLFPISVIYGQSFQNEAFTSLVTVLFAKSWFDFCDKPRIRCFVIALLAFSACLVTRPNNLYMGLPCLFYAMTLSHRWRLSGALMMLGVLSLLAVLPWYWHCYDLTQKSTHVFASLFQQLKNSDSFGGGSFVLRPHLPLIIVKNLLTVVLTPIGAILFVGGVLQALRRRNPVTLFFLVWLSGFLVSVLIMPRKYADHAFYFMQFLVPAAYFVSLAYLAMESRFLFLQKLKWRVVFLFILFMISFRFFAHPAFVTGSEQKDFVHLGMKIKELTPKDAKIAVQGTYSLLYYADRFGWSDQFDIRADEGVSAIKNFEAQQQLTHVVLPHPNRFPENNMLMSHLRQNYRLIYQSPQGNIYERGQV